MTEPSDGAPPVAVAEPPRSEPPIAVVEPPRSEPATAVAEPPRSEPPTAGTVPPGAGPRDRAAWVAAAVLFAWYAATMARGLEWFDSAELALVGRQLGLGHPPGQPLYTWLAGLFSRLPGLDPLVGLNLLSALPAALCAVPAGALLRRATSLGPWARFAVLVAAGTASPVWDQATRIELYALSTLLFLTALAAGARAVERRRGWLGAGVLAGALASVNPVFALAAVLGVAVHALPRLLSTGDANLGRSRALLRPGLAAAAGTLLGLLPYAHLALVRDATDRLVWGELGSWAGVRAYLTGADYAMTGHAAFDRVPEHMGQWLTWMAGEGAAVPLAGVLGWLVWPGLRGVAAWLLAPAAMAVMFTLTYAIYFPEVPDFNGYFTPALWLAALGLGGLWAASRPLGPPALFVCLALTLGTGERPIWTRTRADLTLPDTIARHFLAAAEPGALLIVESDHLFFPLLYLQEVEGERPDVAVVNAGFASSGWYWRFLKRRHPDLPLVPAPTRDARLRALVLARPDTPARVESHDLAVSLGVRPCPATWGFALGPACARRPDDEAVFLRALAEAWQRRPDPLTSRVLAALADQRASGLWALGDGLGAVRAWQAGIPHGPDLPVPREPLSGAPRPPLSVDDGPVLIGSPDRNQVLGAAALDALGHARLASAWRVPH